MGDAVGKAEDGSVRRDVLLSISSCPFTTSPNLSTCHQCGLRLIGRLQTFYSQWRIVLLCRECFAGIRSAQMCSYCFSLFPESENSFLDCLLCFRRVHRACVPLHHRNFSHSQLDAVKFFCIDCRPIPKLRGKDPKASGCSASRTTSMAPLKDSASGTKSTSEKRAVLYAIPKENVTKEKMVGAGFGELNRIELDSVQLVMEPSNNLSGSDEKMDVLLHHQPMNISDKISGSLFPGKEQWGCDAVLRTVDSDSCSHNSKIEDSAENKPLLENKLYSESMFTSCPLFDTDCPGDLILKEIEASIKFPNSTDGVSNAGSQMLPCHSLNTLLKNTKPDDCDGEGSPKLQRKSIGTIGLDRSMKKYFRKRWSSGRIIQGNSQSISSNSPLCKRENLDLMKQTSVCSTNSPSKFSSQGKEGFLRFPDSMYAGSNVASASQPCHSMNTWSNSTMPLINCKFGDGEGSSTIQQSSIRARDSHGTLNKYFRKRWGSGGIIQGNSQSILSNGPLFKQNRECNTASSGDFFLKEESPLKFPESTDNGSNNGCALLPSYSLNDWSYSTVPITKYMFGVGDVDGSSKMQRMSNSIGCRSMKKYFRKHRGSGRIMQKGILNEI